MLYWPRWWNELPPDSLRACNKTLPEIRSDHLSVLLFCRFTKWAPDSTGMNPLNFPEADFWPASLKVVLRRNFRVARDPEHNDEIDRIL